MLITHIISSIIGIVGSYLSSIPLLREMLTKNSITLRRRIVYWGKSLTLLALSGVSITGTQLFLEKPDEFLNTGRFLSNMTIMALLIVVELSFVWTKNLRAVVISRTLSLFSWTWVFIVALTEPSFGYASLTISYLALVTLTCFIISRKIRTN